MISNGYEERKKADLKRYQTNLVSKIQEAYCVLSSANMGGGITRSEMRQVFDRFHAELPYSSGIPDEFAIMWNYATTNDELVHGDAVISVAGLAHFSSIWFSSLNIEELHEGSVIYAIFKRP